MSTMISCIREYVIQKNTITLNEVIKRLSTEKNINAPYGSVKSILYLVRKDLYIEPPLSEAERAIRKYVKKHNNCVSLEEIKNYILNKKCISLTEKNIHRILKRVLKESGGTLKRSGIRQIIREYVIKQKGEVSFVEVRDYVRKKKKIKASDSTIRNTLYFIRKEFDKELKSNTVPQIIREYLKNHKNEVTFSEVRDYILSKNIKRNDDYIKNVLREILKESGRTIKRTGVAEEIRDYFKRNGAKVDISEVREYIFVQKNIKAIPKTVESTFYRVRKEFI